MDSFINLMASTVWSEADIKSRLHAEIRSEISEFAETELNRALQGKFMGLHTLTAAEGASLAKFAAATTRVATLGTQARADMALLNEVLLLEPAQRRLAQAPLEPALDDLGGVTNQPEIDVDTLERDEALAVVAAASPEAIALALLRSPPAVVEPTPEEPVQDSPPPPAEPTP
jgi:hypothetical protein